MQAFPRKVEELKVRIEPEIKAAAQRRAAEFGRTLSQHVRELMRCDLARQAPKVAEVAQHQEAGAQ